jgi:Amt family ammonium transporter
LFYGDPTQLVAQLIGVGTLLGFVFTTSYVANLAIHAIVGQRVLAADELEGLDIPEMGALCYPEFVLKPDTTHSGATAGDFKTGLQVARETA